MYFIHLEQGPSGISVVPATVAVASFAGSFQVTVDASQEDLTDPDCTGLQSTFRGADRLPTWTAVEKTEPLRVQRPAVHSGGKLQR
jgi:hypothetical protein